MKFIQAYTYLLLTWLFDVVATQTDVSCKLTRSLGKAGFHRELLSQLEVPPGLLPDLQSDKNIICSLLFTETIPSGAYVDTFQLNSLLPNGGPKTYLSSSVDIEQPEYVSSSFEVEVFVKLVQEEDGSWYSNYTLPVHLRYHEISRETYKSVRFSNPEIAISCQEIQTHLQHHMYIGPSVRQKQARCQADHTWLCDWTVMECQADTETLSASVPVGNEDHYVLVMISTIITTLGGCLLLSYQALKGSRKVKGT